MFPRGMGLDFCGEAKNDEESVVECNKADRRKRRMAARDGVAISWPNNQKQ